MPRTATIDVTINNFRPLGSVVPCTATYQLQQPCTFVYLDPPNSKNIIVRAAAQNDELEINIKFRVDQSRFNLLGIAFTSANNDIGLTNFKKIEVDTEEGTKRILTVHDMRDHVGTYDYIILVQEISSGIVGIIDPELDNSSEV